LIQSLFDRSSAIRKSERSTRGEECLSRRNVRRIPRMMYNGSFLKSGPVRDRRLRVKGRESG